MFLPSSELARELRGPENARRYVRAAGATGAAAASPTPARATTASAPATTASVRSAPATAAAVASATGAAPRTAGCAASARSAAARARVGRAPRARAVDQALLLAARGERERDHDRDAKEPTHRPDAIGLLGRRRPPFGGEPSWRGVAAKDGLRRRVALRW